MPALSSPTETAPVYRIGIMGPPKAGKDTVAQMLLQTFHQASIHSFSDQLYREVSLAFDVPVARLKDRATKEQPVDFLAIIHCRDKYFLHLCRMMGLDIHQHRSPRDILEWWGTEHRRQQNPRYWIEFVEAFSGIVIIPDVRFADEAAVCDTIWKVTSPGRHLVRDHASDQFWRDFNADVHLLNTGTLEDLSTLVQNLSQTVLHIPANLQPCRITS